MKEWRTAAYYLVNRDLLFLTLEVKTGAIGFSTCPHRATLFTKHETAQSLADQVNHMKSIEQFHIKTTATYDDRVVIG